MSRIYRKGISGGEGSGSSFIESVSESFEVVLKELKLKAGAITNTFLGNESVTNEKVKAKSLEGNRLAKETLGNEEIQTNAVDARVIAAGAVENSELGTEAVSKGKILKETIESEQVKLHGLTIDRLKEGELTEAFLKEKYALLKGRKEEKVVLTGKITSGKKDVKEFTNTEELFPGMEISGAGIEAGTTIEVVNSNTEIEISINATKTENSSLTFTSPLGQTIVGTTEVIGAEKHGLILRGWRGGGAPVLELIQLGATGKAIIRKGTALGILEAAQIEGLEQIKASGTVEGKTVLGTERVQAELFVMGLETPAEITANKVSLEPNKFYQRLTSNKEVWISGIAPLGAPAAVPYIFYITNVGTNNIVFAHEEQKATGKLIKAGFKVTELPEATVAELYTGETVKGVGVPVNTTIKAILSATSIELNKEPTKEENSALEFISPAAASRRIKFSTGKNVKLESGQTLGIIFDLTSLRFRDITALTSSVTPTPSGAPNTVVVGTAGIARRITAAITTEIALLKYKVKHNLGTRAITVDLQTAETKLPSVTNQISEIKAININEVEVTFKEMLSSQEFFLTITG